MGDLLYNTPICIKAIGLEVPHMLGSTVWQRLNVLHGDACLHRHTPKRAVMPNTMGRVTAEERALLQEERQGRLHVGRQQRWHYRFYTAKLPADGLVLPCRSLQGLRLAHWLYLYDPLPYLPIVHLLLSDPVWHPLHRCTKWKAHDHWTLACLWPTYTQVVEQTDCGCGVRVTVGF